MDLRKKVDADHYYWLACEWTNLYLVCRTCNVNKKTLFPVDGERAPVGQPVAGDDLLAVPRRDVGVLYEVL